MRGAVSPAGPGADRRRQAALQPPTSGAEKRKRAAGSAAPLSAPLYAESPAPLCDPRRCARGGGAGTEGAGRGAEGGAPFSAAGPALRPIGWTLPPSGGRSEKRWAGRAFRKGPAGSRVAPGTFRLPHSLPGSLLAAQGQVPDPPPAPPLPTCTAFSQGLAGTLPVDGCRA